MYTAWEYLEYSMSSYFGMLFAIFGINYSDYT